MPPLFGRRTPWKAHPHWWSRYDFAVARPPSRPSRQITTGTVTYVTELPILGVLSVHAGWYFTHVHWVDDEGVAHTFSRGDLVTAFEILIKHWEDVYHLILRLETLYKLTERVYRCFAERRRLLEAKDRLVPKQDPHFHLGLGYGEFLAFLAENERAHVLPTEWRPYRGVIDRPTLTAEPEQFAERERGNVSDYFMRVTLLLLRGQWPFDIDPDPEQQVLVEEADEAAKALAAAAGLDWESITIYTDNTHSGTT